MKCKDFTQKQICFYDLWAKSRDVLCFIKVCEMYLIFCRKTTETKLLFIKRQMCWTTDQLWMVTEEWSTWGKKRILDFLCCSLYQKHVFVLVPLHRRCNPVAFAVPMSNPQDTVFSSSLQTVSLPYSDRDVAFRSLPCHLWLRQPWMRHTCTADERQCHSFLPQIDFLH